MDSDSPTLSGQLRDATALLHREAERSGIISDLLTGCADRFGLACLLRNLLPVYEALEDGLQRHRGSELLHSLARPELYRAAALRDDLHQLGGLPELLAEGAAYADRVTQACGGDGAELLAFAYVRYFGDLSGGQILNRLIGRSLSIAPLAFYQFPAIADPATYRNRYRQALDEAGLLLGNTSRVLSAAQEAFRLDITLSVAVGRMAAGQSA